jgi:hypothetical protein
MNVFSLSEIKHPRRYPAFLFLIFVSALAVRADVVFAWNEFLLRAATNSADPLPPQIEARIFAMMHIAMDEALESVDVGGEDDRSRLTGQRAAAVSAAHTALVRLMPMGEKVFDALASRQLGELVAGPAKERGLRVGRAAADRIVMMRDADRWVDLSIFNPVAASTAESMEMVTARLARGEKLPESPWLQATPFGLKSVGQFTVREVRTFNHNGSQFIDSALTNASVFKRVDRPAAIRRAGEAWTQRPVLIWNRIARRMSVGQSLDLPLQAKLLAILNIAIADATLASLHWRSTVGNWRVVAVETWQPVNSSPPRATDVLAHVDDRGFELVRGETQNLLVPPTAHYPSPAATVAGAVQGALENFFRTDRVDFVLPAGSESGQHVEANNTFSSISMAARECAFVASLNGVHTRESCVAGYFLGQSIGNYTGKRFSPRAR